MMEVQKEQRIIVDGPKLHLPIRFDVSDPTWPAHLRDHGYVVIANAANEAEIQRAKDLFWEFVDRSGRGAQRSRPETWDAYRWIGSSDTGIIHSYGIGQSQFMWLLRSLKPVVKAFRTIWSIDDVITSFDGAGVFRPWQYDSSWLTLGGWYHTDQNALAFSGLQTIQGLLTLYDVDEMTGGFVVIPDSHLDHEGLCQRAKCKPTTGNFVQVPENDPILRFGLGPLLLKCSAGDLVLWDSRTIHCNCPALARPPTETTRTKESTLSKLLSRMSLFSNPTPSRDWDIIRLVGYICMTPRSFATPEILEKRKGAFKGQLTTTHWPQNCLITSRFVKDSEPVPQNFELSPEQLELV